MFMRLHSFIAVLMLASLVGSAASAAEGVQFNYRLPQVGDRSSHLAQYDFDLNIALAQAGKTVSNKKQVKTRTVQRQVTVMQVAGDRALKVQVNYVKAQERTIRGDDEAESSTLPIEGKSYLVERRGLPFPLVITAADGKAVADDERTLVAGNMDSIGYRNQLGRFLHGKSVSIGETLQLPKEMAAELLGMREANGDAQRLELKLSGTHRESGRRIADFATVLIVKMGSSSTLDLSGDLQIDIDTCRVIAADFSGSISSRDAQADHGEVVDVLTDGTLKVAIKSQTVR